MKMHVVVLDYGYEGYSQPVAIYRVGEGQLDKMLKDFPGILHGEQNDLHPKDCHGIPVYFTLDTNPKG